MSILPWQSSSELTESRLRIVAEGLLNVRHDTHAELATKLDDNYIRGCATFGRQRQYLLQLARSGKYDWLTLASPAMDLTINIGNIPVRFFTDDHESPKKGGFYKRNEVDQLFSSDEHDPVLFRFVIEPAVSEEGEDQVYFLGYNTFQEVVVEWRYRPATTVFHAIESAPPISVVQPDAEVELKPAAGTQGDAAASNDG
jgi:hypothetical protein